MHVLNNLRQNINSALYQLYAIEHFDRENNLNYSYQQRRTKERQSVYYSVY